MKKPINAKTKTIPPLSIAEILAASAYGTLLAPDRSIGACCLNAFVKLRNGIQVILVSL